jgi:hypothetical protein
MFWARTCLLMCVEPTLNSWVYNSLSACIAYQSMRCLSYKLWFLICLYLSLCCDSWECAFCRADESGRHMLFDMQKNLK